MKFLISDDDTKAYCEEEIFEELRVSRKLRPSEDRKKLESFKVLSSYIDENGHMNNANYLRVAEEYLPVNRDFSEIEIVYNKEALEGEKIIPYLHQEENGLTISFESMDGELHTMIKLTK